MDGDHVARSRKLIAGVIVARDAQDNNCYMFVSDSVDKSLTTHHGRLIIVGTALPR
jgi:hypothetical protein